MGRSLFNGMPDSGRDGVATRFGSTPARTSPRWGSLARMIFVTTVAAVVIRALSRRNDYQLHLRSLQDSLDVPLNTDDLTLFSPPEAIDQENDDASGPGEPTDAAPPPPASAADNPAIHLQFQGNQLEMVESVPGNGSRACPLDYPVKGVGRAETYTVPGDPGYDELVPTVCFISAAAAIRSGFTRAGTENPEPSGDTSEQRGSDS